MREAPGRSRKSSLRSGGATKVVPMTMRSTMPNASSVRMPERRPMSAKMSPTSPRGTMPTPDREAAEAGPGCGPAGRHLAEDGQDGEPQRHQQQVGAARTARVEQGHVQRAADAHEEDRGEQCTDRANPLLDGVELLGARQDDPGGEGAHDERGAGHVGQRGEGKADGQREHRDRVAGPSSGRRYGRRAARPSRRPPRR